MSIAMTKSAQELDGGVPRFTVDCADGVLDCIGQTPLIRLRRYLDDEKVELFAKVESGNPGGSAKDRPAKRMLEHAIQLGQLNERSTVIESSSGNMGIGLAQACRYHGLRFICVVDPHAQQQNISIMRALGADVRVVEERARGSYLTARLQRVQELLTETANSFWPNQYANLQNPFAHLTGTIREIDLATGGNIDYLFVAASSTGTAQGCRDYLRKHGRRTKVIVVDAVGSVLFGGASGHRMIPGLGAGHEPELAKGQTFDEVRRVSDLDCVIGCRRAARREAILFGGSAGGVLEVVRSMQSQLRGKRSVAILHDSGTRYLDTVFSNDWVEKELSIDSETLDRRINCAALESVDCYR